MSLPENYKSVDKYFRDALIFLKRHQWLYIIHNTHITMHKCLGNISDDWIQFSSKLSGDQFIKFTTGIISGDCPESLKCFLREISEFKPKCPLAVTRNVLVAKRRNVNPKKLHEVLQFGNFVNSICAERNIQYFIDIGAGLGYLPQFLYEQFNYKILGVEGSQKNIQAAISFQDQIYPSSKNFVKYKHFYVTKNSALQLVNYLKESFPEFNDETESFGIIGLHACADLGVNMLRLFQNISSASCLILMPCCYHRIAMKTNQTSINSNEVFTNFPLSNVLKDLFTEFDATSFLRRAFLRLAAQQADTSWAKLSVKQLEVKNANCLFRSILQEVCEAGHLKIFRKRRKTSCTASFSIHDSIATIERNFSFCHVDNTDSPVPIHIIKDRLLEQWTARHERELPAVEMFCVLQNVLQGMCENVVLLDRVHHLREMGYADCQVIKITDQQISPRCYAIVASK